MNISSLILCAPGRGGRSKASPTDETEYYHNYDLAYKRAIQLFPQSAAETFGLDGLGADLSTELTKSPSRTGFSRGDAFNIILDKSGNETNGVCHSEFQAKLTLADLEEFIHRDVMFNYQSRNIKGA